MRIRSIVSEPPLFAPALQAEKFGVWQVCTTTLRDNLRLVIDEVGEIRHEILRAKDG